MSAELLTMNSLRRNIPSSYLSAYTRLATRGVISRVCCGTYICTSTSGGTCTSVASNGSQNAINLQPVRERTVSHKRTISGRLLPRYSGNTGFLLLSRNDMLGNVGRLLPGPGHRSFSMTHVRGQHQDENDQKEKKKYEHGPQQMFIITLLIFIASVRVKFYERQFMADISWNEFLYEMLTKGEVESIDLYLPAKVAIIHVVPGAKIKGKDGHIQRFILRVDEPSKFESKVKLAEMELGISSDQSIPIRYANYDLSSMLLLSSFALLLLLMSLKFLPKISMDIFNPANMLGGIRKANFIRADLQVKTGNSMTFKDVAGLHEAKVEIMEFVNYIRQPDRFTKLGAKVPTGALLLGPPGCGKTLLAKALATEANVPFLVMAGSEFVEMIGGLGATRMRDLFKKAGEKAPCIIYIDEIDAIGRKREGSNWSSSSEEEHTLNQLLVEMDGMSSKKGVILIASTNRADVLDKALLRPGRFDRHILIDYPTLAERKELFAMYLKQLKLGKLDAQYEDRLAQLTPGMTGADIANISNEAALHAARHKKVLVDMYDFEYAVQRVLGGTEKKTSVISVPEKNVIAYHEAGHALVGWLLEHTDPLLRVSIVPRTSYPLGFAQYLPSDKMLQSKEELFEKICVALGGRVAESITFNSVTSGAHTDLEQVTKMAYNQVRELGMNEFIGHVSFPSEEDGMRPYSKYLTNLIDEEAKSLVARAYQATEKLLKNNNSKLRTIAESLLEKEELDYKDVERLIGPPLYTKKNLPPLNQLSP